MMRWVIVLAILVGALLGSGAPAQAGAEWCDTDPLIVVSTPSGRLVPIFILVGAQGVVHLPATQAASLLAASGVAAATSDGQATLITITVTVPDDLFGGPFRTRARATTGPLGNGVVYASTEGTSGATMVLRFTLPIP